MLTYFVFTSWDDKQDTDELPASEFDVEFCTVGRQLFSTRVTNYSIKVSNKEVLKLSLRNCQMSLSEQVYTKGTMALLAMGLCDYDDAH